MEKSNLYGYTSKIVLFAVVLLATIAGAFFWNVFYSRITQFDKDKAYAQSVQEWREIIGLADQYFQTDQKEPFVLPNTLLERVKKFVNARLDLSLYMQSPEGAALYEKRGALIQQHKNDELQLLQQYNMDHQSEAYQADLAELEAQYFKQLKEIDESAPMQKAIAFLPDMHGIPEEASYDTIRRIIIELLGLR